MVFPTPSRAAGEAAAKVVADGGIIVYPTDTLYGFGVDPRDREAVARLYRIKGRERGKPLLLMVRDVEMAATIARFSPVARALAAAFWPGPLSLIVPLRDDVTVWGVGKDRSVGVRAPEHPFREHFFRYYDFPITSTSVNRSGEAPILDPQAICRVFAEKVATCVFDTEHPPRGIPSTVVRVEGESLHLVREGVLSYKTLCAYLRSQGYDVAPC